MKTELRFLLAVVMMFIVLIGTNFLFPPVVPEEAVLPEGATGDSTETVTAVDSGGGPAPVEAVTPTVPPGVSGPGDATPALPEQPAAEAPETGAP